MLKTDPDSKTGERHIKVWDLPLRIFHWVLLLLVACTILSVELGDVVPGAMDWHPRLGYTVLAMILFRLIWGVVGGTNARFSNFVKGPSAILNYIRSLKTKALPVIGHNPLGALSVLALLLSLGVQSVTGLFLDDEDFFIEAPLFKYVSDATAHVLREIHEINASLLFILIGLHVLAIVFYRVVKRENLILPMVTGVKEIPADLVAEDATGGYPLLGLGVAILVAVAVYLLVTLA